MRAGFRSSHYQKIERRTSIHAERSAEQRTAVWALQGADLGNSLCAQHGNARGIRSLQDQNDHVVASGRVPQTTIHQITHTFRCRCCRRTAITRDAMRR
jgi:hypothetical protein